MEERGIEFGEVILVARPADPAPPDAMQAIREILTSSVGLATYTVTTMASIVEQAVTSSVNAALDRIVPVVVDAVIERMDLTGLVLDRVDLRRVVEATLDEMDLTQLVLDRVEVDRIVEAADLELVIDRLPIVGIAEYVIDEIDLPQIIRDSTSGVAGEALDSVRRQGVGADMLLAGFVDRVVRRRSRDLDAPGDPESLQERTVEEPS